MPPQARLLRILFIGLLTAMLTLPGCNPNLWYKIIRNGRKVLFAQYSFMEKQVSVRIHGLYSRGDAGRPVITEIVYEIDNKSDSTLVFAPDAQEIHSTTFHYRYLPGSTLSIPPHDDLTDAVAWASEEKGAVPPTETLTVSKHPILLGGRPLMTDTLECVPEE